MPAYIMVFAVMLSCNASGQPGKRNEKITIRTELGDIHARVNLKNAPVTSSNFLKYIDSHLFDSARFYRVVRLDNQPGDSVLIEVIQGGRFKDENNGFPPIIHETTDITGIRHRNGTLSMARSSPGTATSEFFICIGDQPELDFGGRRNRDLKGFAAFGKVTGGMSVVKRIQSIKSSGQYLETPVLILGITRAGKMRPGNNRK